MTAEEYQTTLQMIGTIARVAEGIAVDDFLAMIDKSESIGPILDPTLYRNFLYDPRAQADMEATKALAHCVKEMQSIVTKLRKKVPT